VPRALKSGSECRTYLALGTPHRERRREWSRHLAVTESETATQEAHVGTADDLLVPPGGIGSRWQQKHRRTGAAGLGLEPRLAHPTAKLTPVGRIGEHAAVPRKCEAVVARGAQGHAEGVSTGKLRLNEQSMGRVRLSATFCPFAWNAYALSSGCNPQL
jgi:hypothetical protein